MELVCLRVVRKWYPENSDLVHGVVYMGAGYMIRDAMAGAEVPAILLRGSRDPFTPPEVRAGYCLLMPQHHQVDWRL